MGLSVGAAHGESTEYLNTTVQLHSSRIYGESPMPDCPQNGLGGYCFKDLVKCGLTSSYSQWTGMTFHPVIPSGKPMHKSHSFGSWSTTAHFHDNEFINFFPKTQMGA